MEKDRSASIQGSGAVAQDHGVAAGAGGVAVGRDIIGDVTVISITYQGVEVSIPSPQAISAHRAALRERLEADARQRWGGMSVYIQEEGATLPMEEQ
jgi:sRNA-binding carbon storage regulator CsrA